jgi:mono/diheme cytochrome c family protein
MKVSRFWIIGLLAFALIIAGLAYIITPESGQQVVINNTPAPPVPNLDASSVRQGQKLYTQYCAICHGANLEGAPDWKIALPDGSYPAPPHDSSGHTFHHPDTLLVRIIADGSYPPELSTTMPAYGEILTTEEVLSILDFIKSHCGDEEREFQWWISVTQGHFYE